MRILLSAAETSSDIHGAYLLGAMREQLKTDGALYEPIEAFGIGGPNLESMGLKISVDARNLLVMGFFEIFHALPRIYRSLKVITKAIEQEKPDIAVLIDYPDFHFYLARRLKRLGIPVVYYIPPKVWVWRKNRIHFLKRNFEKILCIFPFEEEFYKKNKILVKYVGNPLLEELPFEKTKNQVERELSLTSFAFEKRILLMPGSRASELKFHLELMLESAFLCSLKLREKKLLSLGEKLLLLMPFPDTVGLVGIKKRIHQYFEKFPKKKESLEIRLSQGDSSLCMIASYSGLIKSGTSTLEAALLGCPHVLVYRPNSVTAWIFKYLIRYRGPVGLVNLILGEWGGVKKNVIPEILCEKATPENLAKNLFSLITNPLAYSEQLTQFLKLREILKPTQRGKTPSAFAAEEVIEVARLFEKKKMQQEGKKSAKSGRHFVLFIFFSIVSAIWSAGSFLNFWIHFFFCKPVRLGPRTISVGNLEVGGTGKTPLVARIAQEASAQGLSVCILTRGYQSFWEKKGGIITPGSVSPRAEFCGDEALLLQDLCPKVWIGVGADRVRQFEMVQKQSQNQINFVILDDGFQNHGIRKDLEILTLTSARPFEKIFREFRFAMKRADFLVWTKGEKRPFSFGVPMIEGEYQHELENSLDKKKYWLITAVAQPQEALRQIQASGYRILRHLQFKDHYAYQKKEVEQFLYASSQAHCFILLTGKDWVKWRDLGVSLAQVKVLEPQIKFQKGQEIWSKLLWEKYS